MKRTFAALSIVLLLFSFTACSNESGGPAFTGDAQTVANQLKPADLVKELLAGGTPDGDAVISYDLIAQEEGTKALAGIYLLKITVDFKSYETAAGTIIDGILVYEIPGTFTGNSFIEDGSCSIRTEKALVIETADGNVPVTITDLDASLTVSVVSIGTDDKVTAVTAEVTASASMEASVDGDPVEVPPETDTSHDTTPDTDPPESDTEYDAADAEEFAAMLSAEGQVRLVDDFTITGLSFEGESKSFTIDLNEHTLTIDSAGQTAIPAGISVTISNGKLSTTMTSEESVSSIVLGAASSLTLVGVEYTAGSSGIALGTATESGTGATLVVNDSTISVKGVYAISTDATVKESTLLTEDVTITISGSEITADATGGNSCAVMVNIPGTLTITDSTITGNRQGLAVQGGDATITRSKIISTGDYSGGEYYTDGTWGSGSEAPFAALLAGNRNSDEIKTNVTCILEDATIEMKGDN